MNGLFTIGQLVDNLKLAERAVSDDGKWIVYWNEEGLLSFNLKGTEKENHAILHKDRTIKWRILPKYVSFTEAMEALDNGKNVYFHGIDGKYDVKCPSKYLHIKESMLSDFNPLSLYKGKWSIED